MIHFRPRAAAALAAFVIAGLACSSGLPSRIRFRSFNVVLGSSTLTVGQKVTATAVMEDEAGNPIVPTDIVWTSTNPAVATVDAAQITALSAGSTDIAATSEGETATATLTVTPVPVVAATKLTMSTQPSATAASGVAFATQPVVQLRDANSNAVGQGGVAVTTAIASGGGTLGGTTTATTNASGVAAFAGLSISGTSGPRTLSFSASGLTSAASTAITVTTTTAAATNLTITTQPSATATSGSTFGQQPRLQLRDASNAAVAQAGVVVTATLASGTGTLNGTKTATTNASGVASFTNLSIVGAGSYTLGFSASGLTGATSSTITVSAAVSDEPVFVAGTNTMVYQDNMDAYTDATSMGTAPQGTVARIVPHPSPVTVSRPVDVTANQVITPGRNGNGKALRMSNSGADQTGSNFMTVNNTPTANNTTHYLQYWARVHFSSPLQSPVAVKWFMAWHRQSSSTRTQWNTHDHLPCPSGYRETYWQVWDQLETTCQGNQPVGPYFEDVIDNQWHRFTFAFRSNTSAGSRDGFARMWVDGVKVIDVSGATIGVTPPGGEKPWCGADDVDALANNDTIDHVWWGGVQTSYVTSPWTYDIDDFTWWTK
jgi:hypothetical protein